MNILHSIANKDEQFIYSPFGLTTKMFKIQE